MSARRGRRLRPCTCSAAPRSSLRHMSQEPAVPARGCKHCGVPRRRFSHTILLPARAHAAAAAALSPFHSCRCLGSCAPACPVARTPLRAASFASPSTSFRLVFVSEALTHTPRSAVQADCLHAQLAATSLHTHSVACIHCPTPLVHCVPCPPAASSR